MTILTITRIPCSTYIVNVIIYVILTIVGQDVLRDKK